MKTIINIGYISAWTSFIIGTLLLILFLMPKGGQFIGSGLVFLYWAFHVNGTLVLLLLLLVFIDKTNKEHYLESVFAMLFNIPIVFANLIIVMSQTL